MILYPYCKMTTFDATMVLHNDRNRLYYSSFVAMCKNEEKYTRWFSKEKRMVEKLFKQFQNFHFKMSKVCEVGTCNICNRKTVLTNNFIRKKLGDICGICKLLIYPEDNLCTLCDSLHSKFNCNNYEKESCVSCYHKTNDLVKCRGSAYCNVCVVKNIMKCGICEQVKAGNTPHLIRSPYTSNHEFFCDECYLIWRQLIENVHCSSCKKTFNRHLVYKNKEEPLCPACKYPNLLSKLLKK